MDIYRLQKYDILFETGISLEQWPLLLQSG